jgi:hypothetical protein
MDLHDNSQTQPTDVYLFGDPALRLFGGAQMPTVAVAQPADVGDVSAA